MKPRWLLASTMVVVCACGPVEVPDAGTGETNCANGLDDDNNGYADCADALCESAANCQPPPQCSKQTDCFVGGQKYGSYTTKPMPMCVQGTCVTPEALVEIGLTLKTDGWVAPCQMGSINARFVKKAAVDGSVVNCTRLLQYASSKAAADADQIERTGLFNLQAWEAIRLNQKYPCGTTVGSPIIDVATGADFIVWAEIWSESLNSETKLPMGTRWGWACVESGLNVAPILTTDNITRTVSIQMPPPQGYPP